MDAVAAGLGAEIDDREPDAGRLAREDAVTPGEADRHGIDEAIAVVARMEADRAADGRHAEAVAVAADARHHAGHEALRLRMRRLAEAQEVERRDRPRAHREDVAQDAAHARRRALVGLDVGGMVVALHLEDHDVAIADIDHAGVLARPVDDAGALGRQRLQVDLRGFVRAMLVPHGRDDAELGEAGRAADEAEEALVLLRLQAMGLDEIGRDGGFGERRRRGHGPRFSRGRLSGKPGSSAYPSPFSR